MTGAQGPSCRRVRSTSQAVSAEPDGVASRADRRRFAHGTLGAAVVVGAGLGRGANGPRSADCLARGGDLHGLALGDGEGGDAAADLVAGPARRSTRSAWRRSRPSTSVLPPPTDAGGSSRSRAAWLSRS